MEYKVLDNSNPFGGFQTLPHSTAVLVLGILSIVTCCCYGVVGIICGILAIVWANKDQILFDSNPGQFSTASLKNLKAGKICGIVGLCLSVLYVIIIIVSLIFVGSPLKNIPWDDYFK